MKSLLHYEPYNARYPGGDESRQAPIRMEGPMFCVRFLCIACKILRIDWSFCFALLIHPFHFRITSLLIPLNICRRDKNFLPWECEHEKHAYEKCVVLISCVHILTKLVPFIHSQPHGYCSVLIARSTIHCTRYDYSLCVF